MENPLVSIVLATYNRKDYIKKALDSVFSQSYHDFELIIIDQSTDNTKEVISAYLKNPRTRYVFQKEPRLSTARNNGIRISKGKYIAFLDDDDSWIDERKLEKQVNFLEENPDYFLVGGGVVRVDESGKEISRVLNPETDEQTRAAMLFTSVFWPSCVVFRKSAWEKIGGFNEKHDFCEDWEFFLEIGKFGKFYNFQEYFINYLQSSSNRSLSLRLQIAKYNLVLVKRYRSVYPNFARACLVHLCYITYFSLPFSQKLLPLSSKIKRLIFGKTWSKT